MKYFIQLSILLISLNYSIISLGQIKTLSGKTISETEMDRFIKHQMDSLKMPGLSIAIIKKREIVYHRAIGYTNIKTKEKVSNNTLFEAASISKPLFAYIVSTLVRDNLLDLDKPLYLYLPFPDLEHDEQYKLITSRMILSHTSGLPNWRYMDPEGKLNLEFTPGEQFSYSGEGYQYLAKVTSHIVQKYNLNFEDFFQNRIATPLNMKHSFFEENKSLKHLIARPHAGDTLSLCDESWDRTTFNSAGGLRTESLDFAKFLIAEMYGNSDLLTEQIQLPEDNILRKYLGYSSWGLGFAIKESPYGPLYVHAGNNHGFEAAFMIHKKSKTAYVFFTNCDKGMDFDRKLQALILEGK